MKNKKSLLEFYPHRFEVPLLLAGCAILLVIGLSLPIVTVQKTVLWKSAQNTYSVAILVVLAKLRTLTTVEPRLGIYFFGASILLSMITTMIIDTLARKHARS